MKCTAAPGAAGSPEARGGLRNRGRRRGCEPCTLGSHFAILPFNRCFKQPVRLCSGLWQCRDLKGETCIEHLNRQLNQTMVNCYLRHSRVGKPQGQGLRPSLRPTSRRLRSFGVEFPGEQPIGLGISLLEYPEGGMTRLETLIELKFVNSSFSSLSSYWNLTNSSLSSNSRQQYLNQQYPPPS